MLRALIKKQFLEINKGFLRNQKTGKPRSKASLIGLVILYVVIFGSVAYGMYELCNGICGPFFMANISWLYFGLISGIAVVFGVFGSVFTTYSSIYIAKDNDLLLSMPIKVSTILNVRLIGVYLMGLIYSSLIMIPMLVVYYINFTQTLASVLLTLLLYFVVTLYVLGFSCLFGFIVARISVKLKNKSLISVILALVFIALYVLLQNKISNAIAQMIEDGTIFAEQVKTYAYPLYALGQMGIGNLTFSGIVTGIAVLFNVGIYIVMSLTFIKLTTIKSGTRKVKYSDKRIKQKSVRRALLGREFKRYLTSASYILNCSLGSLFMLGLAVYLFIDGDSFFGLFNLLLGSDIKYVVPYAVFFILLIMTTNQISTPSVNLEGKNIWIVQTLPVSTWDILKAKINLHLILTLPAVLLISVATVVSLKADIWYSLLILLITAVYTVFSAEFGLFLNLKFVNLKWMSEMVAIKRGANMSISILGGWAIIILNFVLYSKFIDYISPWLYLTVFAVVFILITIVLWQYLKRKGTKIFESL